MDAPVRPPSVWSAVWLIVKLAFFLVASLEALDIVVVAYQQF